MSEASPTLAKNIVQEFLRTCWFLDVQGEPALLPLPPPFGGVCVCVCVCLSGENQRIHNCAQCLEKTMSGLGRTCLCDDLCSDNKLGKVVN